VASIQTPKARAAADGTNQPMTNNHSPITNNKCFCCGIKRQKQNKELVIGYWLLVIGYLSFRRDQDRPRQSLTNQQMTNNHSQVTNDKFSSGASPFCHPLLLCCSPQRHQILVLGTKLRPARRSLHMCGPMGYDEHAPAMLVMANFV